MQTTAIADAMSTPTCFVADNAGLEQVDEVMQDNGISAVAVIGNKGDLLGVVSRMDLIRAASSVNEHRGARTLVLPEVPVSEVMTRSPLVVKPSDSLAHAAKLMSDKGVHRVFVRDGDELVGVVATLELMQAVRDEGFAIPLSECMSDGVLSVPRGAPIDEVRGLIADRHKHGILVEDEGQPIGVVTLEELMLAQHWPSTFGVEEFMYPRPLCLPVNMPLHRAAGIALANRVRHVVVMDAGGVQGIVTGSDFVSAYARVHKTL